MIELSFIDVPVILISFYNISDFHFLQHLMYALLFYVGVVKVGSQIKNPETHKLIYWF